MNLSKTQRNCSLLLLQGEMLVLYPGTLPKLPTCVILVLAHLYRCLYFFMGNQDFELFLQNWFQVWTDPDLDLWFWAVHIHALCKDVPIFRKPSQRNLLPPQKANPITCFKFLLKDLSILGLVKVTHGGKHSRLPYLILYLNPVLRFVSLAAYELPD